MKRLLRSGLYFLLLFGATNQLYAQQFVTLEDQFFYGTSASDFPQKLKLSKEGNLFLAGATKKENGFYEGYIIKIEPNTHQILWQKVLSGNGNIMLNDLVLVDTFVFVIGNTGNNLPHEENGSIHFASDILLLGLSANTGKTIWQRTLGGSGTDLGNAIVLLKNGDLMAIGASTSKSYDVFPDSTQTENNGWVAVLSKNGMAIRYSVFGGKGFDIFTCATARKNGGAILAGLTFGNYQNNTTQQKTGKPWIVSLTEKGTIAWQFEYPQNGSYTIKSITELPDGSSVLAGSVELPDKGSQFWMLKLSAYGEMHFEKAWGDFGFEQLNAISQCFDKGFIASGYSYYTSSASPYFKGSKDFWIFRLDSKGNILWQETYGGPNNEIGIDVVETLPGLFYALGQKENDFTGNTSSGNDFWVLRIREHVCMDMRPSFTYIPESKSYVRGEPIRFINKSEAGDIWLWDFSDGTKSTEYSPTKKYIRDGSFIVTLTAIKNPHCRLTYSIPAPIIIKE